MDTKECLGTEFEVLYQFPLYAHFPMPTFGQVCPRMPLTLVFTLTTLYSNIQEPFLQWVVWSFYTFFSKSLMFVPVQCVTL